MTARIIDISTREPWVEAAAPAEEPVVGPDHAEDAKSESCDEKATVNIQQVDSVKRFAQMAAQGRIGGFLLIAQDNVTGYFMHELQLPAGLNLHEVFGFIGILENLKLELAEKAAFAPTVTLDGTIVDPYKELLP